MSEKDREELFPTEELAAVSVESEELFPADGPAEQEESAPQEEPFEDIELFPAEEAGGQTGGELPEDGGESNVETFIPTEYFTDEEAPRRRIWIIVLIAVGALLLAAVIGAFCWYLKLKNNPASVFDIPQTTAIPLNVNIEVEETPAPSLEPLTETTPEPTATPTLDPYATLEQRADTSIMQNILTVCLIGVDYADERETGYGGKAKDNAFHADVILLLAINFDENRVDMISLPRDTYSKIPGIDGIYKINASLDCGGGLFAEDGAGFKKVCETASWQLGGLPVDYYYAVTMPAVKQLGDAVGGVDFDLDIDFTIQGRSYKQGIQHMDGQGILDYLRVRKNIAQSGDNNRVKRQKKMLVALFESMKEQNLILKIPDILSAFEGQLYTNTNLEQTAALALFAYNLNSNDIGMYSMGSGSSGTSGVTNIFNWNFCLTDQQNRVDLIEKIYGVKVPQHLEYTRTYAWYRWDTMLAKKAMSTCSDLTAYAKKALEADDQLPIATPIPEPTETPYEPTEKPADPTEKPADPTEKPADPPEDPTAPPAEGGNDGEQASYRTAARDGFVRLSAHTGAGDTAQQASSAPRTDNTGTRRYTDADHELFYEYLDALDALSEAMTEASEQASKYLNGKSNHLGTATDTLEARINRVKSMATSVANTFGYSASKLNWHVSYETDSDFNEVKVNFN